MTALIRRAPRHTPIHPGLNEQSAFHKNVRVRAPWDMASHVMQSGRRRMQGNLLCADPGTSSARLLLHSTAFRASVVVKENGTFLRPFSI